LLSYCLSSPVQSRMVLLSYCLNSPVQHKARPAPATKSSKLTPDVDFVTFLASKLDAGTFGFHTMDDTDLIDLDGKLRVTD